jgi:HK97 family phage portal protein
MSSARQIISRIFAPFIRAGEGEVRPGPLNLPLSGGWLPAGAPWNWWQHGMDLQGYSPSAIVERCIAAYSETIASLTPAVHWRENSRGGKTRITTSAASRVLRQPNSYETSSNFMLNLVRSLYLDGNAYALALRNERYAVDEFHLMNPRLSAPQVALTGDVFYRLGGNAVIERMISGSQLIVPARDVLHIRLHESERHPWPLVGETPLVAAMADIGISNAFTDQQINFLMNQARPSAVLSTDLTLDAAQVQALRDRWNEQSKGLHAGGIPILTAGLKVQPWATPAKDAQLAELMKLSAEKICHAFRVPLQLLGLGGAPLGSTEALMHFWLSSGLGFALNHVEQSFDRLFGLRGAPEEYCEFDTEALLRSNQKDRIEMLVRGVQGGIYSPNEARNQEGLDSVPFGDEPRVQQQVVPLSAAGAIPSAPAAPSAPATPDQYQRDFDALTRRAARRERTSNVRDRGHYSSDYHSEATLQHVIRKWRENGRANGGMHD